jgi:hypothetical protein
MSAIVPGLENSNGSFQKHIKSFRFLPYGKKFCFLAQAYNAGMFFYKGQFPVQKRIKEFRLSYWRRIQNLL